MDGWVGGLMNGQKDGRMDGWSDGRTDGWTDGRRLQGYATRSYHDHHPERDHYVETTIYS